LDWKTRQFIEIIKNTPAPKVKGIIDVVQRANAVNGWKTEILKEPEKILPKQTDNPKDPEHYNEPEDIYSKQYLCVAKTTVKRTDGKEFTAHGSAHPLSVSGNLRPKIIEMAETRSLARALRFAFNIHAVTAEEIELLEELKQTYLKNIAGFPPVLYKKEMQRLKNIYLAMKENVETKELGTVDIENIPPCMRNLLIHLQHGENVPHAGRFALTAFLHKIGFTNQEILNLHKNAPDFDEKLAAYQIDHITGKISSTEYTPQSCSTMDNLGLCVNRDLLCSKIIHPLGYYHAKNEAHRPARIREKRYVDFLVSYFSLMEKKDEKALGRHIMEAVHKAELFGEEKKKGKMLNENSQKEWNLIELKFLTGEKGFIKTLKLEDEKGVRYVLYAELRATDSRGKMVRFLPTLDMALAMKIFERRGKWVKALCRDIPLFKKRYLYLHAIYKESNGHLHGKI